MKKTMRLVILALIAAMALAGCGKSDVATPKGIYENNGNTLTFSDDIVIVTEGGMSTSCDYTSDKDGNLVIDPKGEKIPASYDADADVVTVYHVKYRKGSGSTGNRDVFSVEEADLVSIPEDMAEEGGYNKDMFSDYLSFTEEGPLRLRLVEPGKSAVYKSGIAKYEYDIEKYPEEYIEVYKELSASGNKVTATTEDGRERVWVFDEEKGTLSSEGYCFYKSRREYIEGKIAASDKTLEGNYTGIYQGSWNVAHGSLLPGSRVADFQFHADHTLESMLDQDYHFIRGKYWIEYGYFYTYAEWDDELRVGTYDEASDTITFMGMELTRVTEE